MNLNTYRPWVCRAVKEKVSSYNRVMNMEMRDKYRKCK